MSNKENHQIILRIETRIKKSVTYQDWARRRLQACCNVVGCDAPKEELEVHHVIPLYNYIRYILDHNDDEDEVYRTVLEDHRLDRIHNVTLCNEHHGKKHPKRRRTTEPSKLTQEEIQRYTAFPRNFNFRLKYSTADKRPDAVGCVSFRIFLVLGWYVMNGYLQDDDSLDIPIRSLASNLGIRRAGTSWMKSLNMALNELERVDVLRDSLIVDKNLKLSLHGDYIKGLCKNPWFVPITDAHYSKMLEVAVRVKISYYRNFPGAKSRRDWQIGIAKLMGEKHLGIQDKRKDKFVERLLSVTKGIGWIRNVTFNRGIFRFKFINKGAIPVYTLRPLLIDLVAK